MLLMLVKMPHRGASNEYPQNMLFFFFLGGGGGVCFVFLEK